MREPGVDRTRPLAQVELRKEWLIHRFQRSEDSTDFFGGVAGYAAEGGQFVARDDEIAERRGSGKSNVSFKGIVSPRPAATRHTPLG